MHELEPLQVIYICTDVLISPDCLEVIDLCVKLR